MKTSEGRFALDASAATQLVPVQFITPKDQVLLGDQTATYSASLCGGALLDGETARVAINLVNNEWNDAKGDIIAVKASDYQGNVIATNIVSNGKEHIQDFHFVYYSR